jgi:hypothetical protein
MVRVTPNGIKAATEFHRAVMNISGGIAWEKKPVASGNLQAEYHQESFGSRR